MRCYVIDANVPSTLWFRKMMLTRCVHCYGTPAERLCSITRRNASISRPSARWRRARSSTYRKMTSHMAQKAANR